MGDKVLFDFKLSLFTGRVGTPPVLQDLVFGFHVSHPSFPGFEQIRWLGTIFQDAGIRLNVLGEMFSIAA